MLSSLPCAASNTRSIHLLRALLREASYLPDSHARQYFRRYIVARFKAYQPSHNATASADVQAVEKYRHRAFKRCHVSTTIERTRATQRKAQKGLNYLRRANQGELHCLEKILLFTYGRLGRRKYALLRELLKPELPVGGDEGDVLSQEEPAPLQKLYYSNKRFLSFFEAPKKVSDKEITIDISDRYSRLKAVVKTQLGSGIALRRELKSKHVRTSIYNIWERPMPVKRARNNVKRWYAETMTKLLPPLPVEEWDRLRALASGEQWIDFTRRRTSAIELSPRPKEEAQWEALIEGLALDKPSKADRPRGPQRPHSINTRFMRRLYTKILGFSCKLEWNERRNKWTAQWGSLTDTSPRVYSAPVDEVLFAGVDKNGRLLKNNSKESATESAKGSINSKALSETIAH